MNGAEVMLKSSLSSSMKDRIAESKKINMGVKATMGYEEEYAPMIPDVDPNFYEDPKVVNILEFCLKQRSNLMLVGPPGIGKSSIVLNVAGRMNQAVEYYGCSGESNTDQLIGTPSATIINGVKVPVAVYGAAVLAFKHGSILLMDEADFITPEVASCLHQIAEISTKRITIYLNGKHIIERHPDFCIIGTANTVGSGEDGFIYHGTQSQNAAFLNRFTYTANMSYLPSNKEAELVAMKTGVSIVLAGKMVQAAEDTRKEVSKEVLVTGISPRDLFAWGTLMNKKGMDWLEAASFAFLNRVSKSDRSAIETIVRNRRPA
jgi:cobaltochelatase CobS